MLASPIVNPMPSRAPNAAQSSDLTPVTAALGFGCVIRLPMIGIDWRKFDDSFRFPSIACADNVIRDATFVSYLVCTSCFGVKRCDLHVTFCTLGRSASSARLLQCGLRLERGSFA